MRVKGATWETDFLYADLSSDAIRASGNDERDRLIYAAERSEGSLTMDFDIYGRDGLFEDRQLYAVWEKDDVEALMAKLEECLASAAYSLPTPATLQAEAPIHDSDRN